MSRIYSIRDFLRLAPNYMLKQYMNDNNIKHDVDFEKLTATKIEPLFQAITSIEDDHCRKMVDSDFQSIFQMSYEGGFKKILQSANYAGLDLQPDFEKMNGFYEKVFYVFITHRKLFEDALRFACTDYLKKTYWRKIKNVRPANQPNYEKKTKELESGISQFFRKTEGRGKSCTADHYKQGNLHYYFCYPEDYSKSELSWEKGVFAKRVTNPAFEVIFVYDVISETLDSYFDGQKKTDTKLKKIFLDKVLGIDEIPEIEETFYNIDIIKSPAFEFIVPVDSKIKKVMIQSLRFNTKIRKIDVTEHAPKESVQAMIDDIKKNRQDINLSSDCIDQITIVATLEANNRRGFKTKEFTISKDSISRLNYNDENDLLLRQMIIDWGIESIVTQKQELKVA